MEKYKVSRIEWESLKSGTTLQMKDFPSVRILKLDNRKGCYFGFDNCVCLVDIKEHTSEYAGNYYVFQINQDDWHPLTNRLWKMV